VLIDQIIGCGILFLYGVVAFTFHWWLGRQIRVEREAAAEKTKVSL
jgi:hypothetical protein